MAAPGTPNAGQAPNSSAAEPRVRSQMPAGSVAAAGPLPPLTVAQLSSFKRDGFLLLEDALDPTQCAAAMDKIWNDQQAGLARILGLDRADPASWRGPLSPAQIAASEEDTRSAEERSSGVLPMLPVR